MHGTSAADNVRSHELHIDVSSMAPAGVTDIVAEVFVPPIDVDDGCRSVLFCFPGGGMSRRYYDLKVPAATGCFSMARYLAELGHLTVTVDHVGVGDSSRPTDGFSLTPEVVADVDAAAVDHLKDLLVGGTCCDGLSPVTAPTWIGLGHSMGAKLAIAQQARHRVYDGLVLLGIGARGLNIPSHPRGKGWTPVAETGILSDEVLAYVDDPEGLRGAIVALGRSRYGSDALPQGTTATSDLLIAGMPVPPEALAAIAASSTSLLGLCGLTAMVPGSASQEMAKVDVPVFLGIGSRDIAGPPHDVPAAFTASRDVTLFVLPEAGHNHNVAPNRVDLWDRIASWVPTVHPRATEG